MPLLLPHSRAPIHPQAVARAAATLALLALYLLCPAPGVGAPSNTPPAITHLDLRQASVADAARLLTRATGHTVLASAQAREHIIDATFAAAPLEQILTMIGRSTGLVYRYDEPTRSYILLTLEEYQHSHRGIGAESRETRVFKVDSANLNQIAAAISHLFGGDVFVSGGQPVEDFRQSPGEMGGMGSFANVGTTRRNSRVLGGQTRGFGTDFATLGAWSSPGFADLDRRSRNPQAWNQPGSFEQGFGAAYGGTSWPPAAAPFHGNRLTAETALQIESARAPGATDTPESPEATAARISAATEPTIFVSLNYEHSKLIARSANPAALDEIESLIDRLDTPVPQVILELKILQLDVSDGIQLAASSTITDGPGVFEPSARDPITGEPTEFSFLGDRNTFNLGNFSTLSGATFAYQYLSERIDARIEMLSQSNRVEVIATPVLVATNNRPARIEVGEERVITIGATAETVTAPLTGAREELIRPITEQRIIGVTLDLIPRINDDGTITLSVFQESTTLKPQNNSIPVGTTLVPIDSVDTANVDANVVARDASTIAIGGLIRTEKFDIRKKVPILGDIPLLGIPFRSTDTGHRKTEVILLVTPHIIPSGTSGTQQSRALVERLSNHPFHDGGDSAVDKQPPIWRQILPGGDEGVSSSHWDLLDGSATPQDSLP